MTTIVKLRTRSANKISKQSAGAAALLASLSRGLDLTAQADFKSKEDLQQALYFISSRYRMCTCAISLAKPRAMKVGADAGSNRSH